MRVTFVLGRLRVVVASSSRRVVGGRVDSGGLDVSGDVGDVDSGLMSVVAGGLVLVIVAVVVGVSDERDDRVVLAEKLGSTKLIGACSGSLNWPEIHDAEAMTTAIAASAATLAPSSVAVRLCHGTSGGS